VRVLVVEDEQKVANALREGLEGERYDVVVERTGEDAFFRMTTEAFDLILLDLGLPGRDGLQILTTLRSKGVKTPVLVLTARDTLQDRVAGLDSGADDYLVKPFAFAELLARIRALLRRARAQASVADAISKVRAYRFGGWELNVGLRKLRSPKGETVELTKGEFSLLAAFLSTPQRILAREQLLELSRLHNAEVYDRSIDVQILRLRRKIEADPAHPRFIVTERGVGYVFSSAVETVR
jgi:two-component system, OmpR family, response regulator